MAQACQDTAKQVKNKVMPMPQRIFQVVAKNGQVQHIAAEVRPSAMQEHGGDQGEKNRYACWLQAGQFKRVPGVRVNQYLVWRNNIMTG